MSLSAFMVLLLLLAILGYMTAKVAGSRPNTIPAWLARFWLRGFITFLVLGPVFFLSMIGGAILGHPMLSNMLVRFAMRWFPQDDNVFGATTVLFGLVSFPVLVWGVTGLGAIPFIAWSFIKNTRDRYPNFG